MESLNAPETRITEPSKLEFCEHRLPFAALLYRQPQILSNAELVQMGYRGSGGVSWRWKWQFFTLTLEAKSGQVGPKREEELP
jgi:hypothetical protein